MRRAPGPWLRQVNRAWSAALPPLAAVAVEDGLALEAEITGPEADHLRPSAPGQEKDQEDRPVASATHGIRHDGEEPTDLIGAVPPGDGGDGPRALKSIAGVGGQEAHPDREAVEGGETGDPGPTVVEDGVRPEAPIPWA